MTEMAGSASQKGRSPGKSASAFRTISEVSAELDVPQHVLRFWETKFPQIKPLKRGGGRRYYRPDDVELLRRIQSFLYKEGYTIKGVQRLLKETKGVPPSVAAIETAPDPSTKPLRGDDPPIAGLFDDEPEDRSDVVLHETGIEHEREAPFPQPRRRAIPAEKRRQLEAVLAELEQIRAVLDQDFGN